MERTDRLGKLMERDGIDAVIVTAPEDTFYFTGALIVTQKLIPDRPGIVVIARASEPIFIVSRMEEVLARRLSRLHDIRTYTFVEYGRGVEGDHPISILLNYLRDAALHRGVIGIQARALPVAMSELLSAGVPDAKLVDCGDLLSEVQRIKEPSEIDHLTTAAQATRAAVRSAFDAAQVGWTEKQLADRIAANMRSSGADFVSYILLATGEHGAMSHWVPDSTPIRDGDVVRVDVMGLYSGYCSDYAWTAVAGEPTETQARVFRAVVGAHTAAIDAMRPGVSVRDLYLIARRRMEAQGMPFRSLHIGHGLGVHLHERPMIAPGATEVLEDGMVLNVEVFCRDGVSAGYHVEDSVRITPGGHQVITAPLVSGALPIIGRRPSGAQG